MMECSDEELEKHMEKSKGLKLERAKVLGFMPQKELFCNKNLPYADKLDSDSQKMLEEIKCLLGRCLAVRDIVGISALTHLLQK